MTRPLIFSAPMVRAILDGRKTMTRRVLKPQPPDGARFMGIHHASDEPDTWFFNSPKGPFKVRERFSEGDRLWVKEKHRPHASGVDYGADIHEAQHSQLGGWISSMMMAKRFSRLTLIVESVRVERLQEISEADAIREGVEKPILPHWSGQPYRSAFRGLWLDIHGPGSWEANPWVAVIGFRVALRATGGPQVEANEKRNQRDENG